MKKISIIFVILSLILFLSESCGGNKSEKEKKQDKTEKNEIKDTVVKIKKTDTISVNRDKNTQKENSGEKKQEKIYKYICPMSCKEGHSDNPGNCPECEMEMIENPNYETKQK